MWQWQNSPVTKSWFRGQEVHVKRDDVFHLAGNKMRKLWYFLRQNDMFYTKTHLVSYGGSQSNAMVAMAQLANVKRLPFTYFSRTFKSKDNSIEGNLLLSKTLGMQHIQLQPDVYHDLVSSRNFSAFFKREWRPSSDTKILCVPQGVATLEAQEGVKLLAHEINTYVQTCGTLFAVVIPCGTGTTALYLAQHLHTDITLFAIPCVGDAAFLTKQFQQLIVEDPSLDMNSVVFPQILNPKEKNRFGRPWWPLYHMYHELLQETQVDFDLIYGAFAWYTLFSDTTQLDKVLNCTTYNSKRQFMYIHTGGTSGNATMLSRYEHKNKS
ncbi:putative 1-aminocyclopropane-1-carboxylate deaminase/D-cysteine desulfhydrase [Plasmopara halstedii]